MDVPTRQALVMAVVTPAERTPAAATTNAARYVVRPFGPIIAAALQQISLGAPLVVSGVVKAGYDLSLWAWGSRHHLDTTRSAQPRSAGRARGHHGRMTTSVTRERPKTDRIACPWLIRRFIDADAEIVYVPADQVLVVAEREGGCSFDAPGATYTHHGNACSFETLIDEYQLGTDPALGRLARIVHAADIDEDLDTDALGAGLLAIGIGGLAVESDDHRLLERGSTMSREDPAARRHLLSSFHLTVPVPALQLTVPVPDMDRPLTVPVYVAVTLACTTWNSIAVPCTVPLICSFVTQDEPVARDAP